MSLGSDGGATRAKRWRGGIQEEAWRVGSRDDEDGAGVQARGSARREGIAPPTRGWVFWPSRRVSHVRRVSGGVTVTVGRGLPKVELSPRSKVRSGRQRRRRRRVGGRGGGGALGVGGCGRQCGG